MWRNQAACLDEEPELFFSVGSTSIAAMQVRKAKAVCGGCEVARACLRWAMETHQDAGVWGGMSEDERRALSRRNTRARRVARTGS
jgi:WhiB family redox-sensing transcriptional regulator